jgi:hypothetical protein
MVHTEIAREFQDMNMVSPSPIHSHGIALSKVIVIILYACTLESKAVIKHI